MNTDVPVGDLPRVGLGVPEIQAKLHRRAVDEPHRRFDDLYNLICDPAFLAVAWERVRSNRDAGTPQGGVLSSLLANIDLSVLDEYMTAKPVTPREREQRRKHGLPNCRLIRYADDFVILVIGNREDAVALLPEIAELLSTVGLRLSEEETLIAHIDEGTDFLGWRIQRHRQKGSGKRYVYTYPSKKAVRSAMARVKKITSRKNINRTLASVLRQVNTMLRGWAEYFRYGVSSAAFQYLTNYLWLRLGIWMRRKHRRLTWKELRHRYRGGGRIPTQDGISTIDLGSISTKRYSYRGAKIVTPWVPVTRAVT